jgi:hypothetical protein
MDFSKAFDKVSHSHLTKKMEYYGVQGQTLTWIAEFLSDRKQCVQLEVEGEKSDKVPLGPSQSPQEFHKGLSLDPHYSSTI